MLSIAILISVSQAHISVSQAQCDPLSTSGEITSNICKFTTEDTNLDFYIGLDEAAQVVNLCAVNMLGDGYMALGMGKTMGEGFLAVMAADDHKVVDVSGYNAPQDAASDMGLTLIHNKVVDGKRHNCFTLPLSKLHPNGAPSVPNANFAYAIGDSTTVAYHSKRGSFKIGLKSLSGTTAKIETPTLLVAHVVLQLISFGLLFPVGVLIAGYAGPHFARGAKFFKLHRAAMALAILVTIGGVSCAFAHSPVDSNHGYGGLVVVGLALLQPINGALRPGKDHKNRRAWEIIHKTIGRLVALLGFAVMLVGAKLYTDSFGSKSLIFALVIVPIGISIPLWIVFRGLAMSFVKKKDAQEEKGMTSPSAPRLSTQE